MPVEKTAEGEKPQRWWQFWQTRASQPLGLRALTPEPVAEQHDLYSTELVALLRDRKRRRNVWNIALTGSYGSGKSSVLASVRAELPRRVVEISLSSLSDIGVQADAKEDETNNLIQKEIVKQLLYRERTSKLPGSRFRRISRLPLWRTVLVSAVIGAVAAGVLWLTGLGTPLDLPPERESERPLLLLAIGAGVAILALALQAVLHNRVRVDKLGTASASVSLKTDSVGEDGSFFDKYLDEIVYFFEKTRRTILIIEDLDRFENPAIYGSLRALNTILNTSRQLHRRPVHFIYAVRDSIFEDLTKTPSPPAGPPQKKEPAQPDPAEKSGVWQAHSLLSNPPTQRTKFFDLVVPIVPFITHQNSRDLLVKEMKKVDSSVSIEVLSIVAKHVTDMRLLLNIINEYRVFQTRVLVPKKLRGLTPSKLFAMVAFKNTRLTDFELIRVGDSSLDRLYRVSREIIDEGLAEVADEIATVETQADPVAETVARAEQLGTALQTLAERWLPRLNHQPQSLRFLINGKVQATTEISTSAFWESVVDKGAVVEVLASSTEVFKIDAAGLRAELGTMVPERWSVQKRAAHTAELQRLRGLQQWLRSADFHALTDPRRELHRKDKTEVDFRTTYVEALADPLLEDLILDGHIDRNYHLYMSEFHGQVASADAMSFLIQHVRAEQPSYRYPLKPEEVGAVLREGGPGVFNSTGLFNIAVYDTLLQSSDTRLERNLKLLSWVRPSGAEFIEAYIAEGKHQEQLFERLAPLWDEVFVFISEQAKDEITRLAIAALDGVDLATEYPVPEPVRERIAANYNKIQSLTDDAREPTRTVEVLQHLGVRLPSLRDLSRTALQEIIAARQYRVTEENLRIVLDGTDEIGIDKVFEAGHDVSDHVLAHFDEYLAALDGTNPSEPSLRNMDSLIEIMTAVEASEPGESMQLLTRLPKGAKVQDLTAVPDSLKTLLARAQRFALNFSNVNAYIAACTIDEALVDFLEAQPSIDASDASAEQQDLLASQLLNVKKLTVASRVNLAKSITRAPLAISKISAREPELISGLMQAGLLVDDPDTFAALSKSQGAQVAFIISSTDAENYFTQLTLTPAVLALFLRDDHVKDGIKTLIVNGLPQAPQNATDEVLEAAAEWATTTSTPLPHDTAQLVQQSGVATPLKAAMLNLSASECGTDELVEYIQQLPSPYRDLLERGTTVVDLPADPDFETALQKLETDGAGAVTSWKRVDDFTRVWRRHPPKKRDDSAPA
ncbi:YobI family P-loop NTPase [Microbacterium sp. JB110]|uniref:YobI family P-loop NTPase n=1 Tax=Microbacterium sp. JB110 TaxID=2024477 RepID=UPI0015EFF5D0|nr:P-loop NTPase fold protein [Microbacterium sp. JB110]